MRTIGIFRLLGCVISLCLLGCNTEMASVKPLATEVTASNTPNILLIVSDDMGYTDIAPFGGEIATPNIDALAQNGISLTNFYASLSCSPTRAMLLSGMDNHLVRVGDGFHMLGHAKNFLQNYQSSFGFAFGLD